MREKCGPVEASPVAQVDIAQHGETNAKATSTHAALLARGDVRIFRHNSSTTHHRRQQSLSLKLPDYDPKTTVVLFPESKVLERRQSFGEGLSELLAVHLRVLE